MLGHFWKKHFSLENFYPIHDDPGIFVACQWQMDKTRPNLKYLAYRIIITLTFFVTWVLSMVEEKRDGKWPIFLTNWGYTLCTAQALLASLMLTSCVLAEKFPKLPNLRQRALKIYSIYWILNTLATSTAFGITFVYWIVIYDAKAMKFNAMNYFVHGNNSILMMLDLWMVAHPVRILHCLYIGLFAISYWIFSIIYFAAGGTSRDGSRCIYKIVDWDKPVPTTFTCLGMMVFLILLHMMTVAISATRRRLNERCRKVRSSMTETKGQAAYVNEGMSSGIV